MPGAADDGWLWESHRNKRLAEWGWSQICAEPAAFIYTCPQFHTIIRMLCSTDDFLVATSSTALLEQWRKRFQAEWSITVRSPVSQHLSIKLDIKPYHGITISNPKIINQLLQDNGMASVKPALLPYITSLNIDIATKVENTLTNSECSWYRATLGAVRFLTDTTHP